MASWLVSRPIASMVFNPPYKLGQAFIEKALSIATEKVAVLVQSKFPYSRGRYRLFTGRRPAIMYHLSDRPSMPPGDKLLSGEVKAEGGKIDYLWIVWRKGHTGLTAADWLVRP